MKCDVGLIDNGLNLNYFADVNHVKRNISIDYNGTFFEGESTKWLTHGSICAAIIKKYAPNSELTCINLKPREGEISVQQLVLALETLISMNIKLINISMGFVSKCENISLKQVIHRAFEKQCLIIASGNNFGVRSFPACYNTVIGVVQTPKIQINSTNWNIVDSRVTGIDFSVCGSHELVKSDLLLYETPNASSFSACVMTANIFNILQFETCMPNVLEMKSKLKKMTFCD